MGNALLGNFNDYAELGGKPNTPWVATAFDWFVQDSWKATKKLTARVWRAALHLAAVAQPLEQPRRIPSGLSTIRPRPR